MQTVSRHETSKETSWCIAEKDEIISIKINILRPTQQSNKKPPFSLYFKIGLPNIIYEKEDFNFDKPLMRTVDSINYWRVSVCAESPRTRRNAGDFNSIAGIFYHNINVLILPNVVAKESWKNFLCSFKIFSAKLLLQRNPFAYVEQQFLL